MSDLQSLITPLHTTACKLASYIENKFSIMSRSFELVVKETKQPLDIQSAHVGVAVSGFLSGMHRIHSLQFRVALMFNAPHRRNHCDDGVQERHG